MGLDKHDNPTIKSSSAHQVYTNSSAAERDWEVGEPGDDDTITTDKRRENQETVNHTIFLRVGHSWSI